MRVTSTTGQSRIPRIVRRKRRHDGSFLTTLDLYEAREVACSSDDYRIELLLDPDYAGSPQPWFGINVTGTFAARGSAVRAAAA